MENTRKAYHESFKRMLVSELESGVQSIADASVEYGVSKSMIHLWLREYGQFRPSKSIVEVVMKSEKEKIAELEKALAAAHLKIRVYDELIKVADKKLKVDIKKNFGTPSSEVFEGKSTKSRESAKRSK